MAPWSGGRLLQVLSYIVITCNYNKNKAPRWEVTFYIQVQQEISYIKVCPHKMSHVYVNDAIMGIFLEHGYHVMTPKKNTFVLKMHRITFQNIKF